MIKKPLLIDQRLDNLNLSKNATIFINPAEINVIECRRASVTIKYNQENNEGNNKDKEVDQEQIEREEELEGYNTIIYTRSSPRDRFSFFTTTPDFEWLKKNCKDIGLSKLYENSETQELTFINKNNLLDVRLDIREKELIDQAYENTKVELEKQITEENKEQIEKMIAEIKRLPDAEMVMFFYSPIEPREDNKDGGYENLFPYSLQFEIKEHLKNERPYTIINDFFNGF